ncbi:MAG: DUF5711 family protein [Clostridiales bacterium]|nr:DUF5711 family protein [Clostridiales bacterium]
MAEDRDKILNELIKYYDGDAKAAEEEDMGSTRIIGKKTEPVKEAPVDTGDTVTVNLRKQPAMDNTNGAAMSHTRRIEPQEMQKITRNESEREVSSPVEEEILGNLGIDGKPITSAQTHLPEPHAEEPRQIPKQKPEPREYIRQTEPKSNDQEYNYSLWYMLKPLWITLIICVVLFGGFRFYMTDTGIIGAYKRNFEYNMTVLLDLFGIDLDNIGTDAPVIGEQNGSFVTLADDEALIQSFGTNIDGSSAETAVVDRGLPENQLTASNTVHESASSKYSEVKGGTVILPFEEADSSDFSLSKDGVVCAKSNYICCINENGKTVWESDMPVTNPVVSSSGNYTAAASSGSTQLCVFENGKLKYNLDTEDNIVSCDISERGDVVLITTKTAYKGAVVVYNKNGEKIFSWSSGTNYITAASMLKTRLVAVSLVNAASSVTSYVMLFDVKSPEPISGYELENTLIFDVGNNGRLVFPTGDNCIASLTGYNGINYDMRFDDVRLTHSSIDSNGNRLITYTQNNTPVINLYNKKGVLEYDAIINSKPSCIDVYGSTILYNNGREIICGKYSDETPSRYTASMSIQKLMLLNSKAYVIIYNNSLEFVKL